MSHMTDCFSVSFPYQIAFDLAQERPLIPANFLREASHIDFTHKKRHLYVSLETPHPPPLETSKIFIDIFVKDTTFSRF